MNSYVKERKRGTIRKNKRRGESHKQKEDGGRASVGIVPLFSNNNTVVLSESRASA